MWSLTRPSDARIVWNNGAIATQAEVTVDRRSRNLTGTVRTVGAPQPEESSASIRLVRKPCG
jgi:hypothetical protein